MKNFKCQWLKVIMVIFIIILVINPVIAENKKLFKAVKKGKITALNRMIKQGIDVNMKDEDGWTPLMYAAANNDTKIAQVLLKAGANVEARDKDGRTALIYAAAKNNIEVTKILLEAGAKVYTFDYFSSEIKNLLSTYMFQKLINQGAPKFFMKGIDGNDYVSNKLYGPGAQNNQPIILNFFATWAKPCTHQLSFLNTISQKYPNIGFYLVNIEESEERVRTWSNAMENEFPILMDRDGKVAGNFHIQAIPTLFVINSDGSILNRIIGFSKTNQAEMQAKIEKVLGP